MFLFGCGILVGLAVAYIAMRLGFRSKRLCYIREVERIAYESIGITRRHKEPFAEFIERCHRTKLTTEDPHLDPEMIQLDWTEWQINHGQTRGTG